MSAGPVTLELLHEKLENLQSLLEETAVPGARSRPLTAQQLLDRWNIPGASLSERLHNLAERCRARGLRRMEGTRGIHATYMLADVIAAEAYASGKSKRRRHAA